MISKPSTKQYEDGWDLIFGKQKRDCQICGKDLDSPEECAWTSCPKLFDENRIDRIGQNGNTGEHYFE